MSRLQVQANRDERDLRLVVYGTYGMGAVIGILSLVGLVILLMSGIWGGFPVLIGLITVVCGFLYAWANVQSARAIAAREDPHLSFFVCGLNMAAFFPFGALLSMCTWNVLCRPSVRDIYADPHRPPSLPHQAQEPALKKGKAAAKPILVEAAAPNFEDAEEAIWREMEKQHNKKQAADAKDKIKIVSADDAANQ